MKKHHVHFFDMTYANGEKKQGLLLCGVRSREMAMRFGMALELDME
jgi:hypothetical protein